MPKKETLTSYFHISEAWGLVIAIMFVIATYIITVAFIVSDNTVAKCIHDLEDRIDILEEELGIIS